MAQPQRCRPHPHHGQLQARDSGKLVQRVAFAGKVDRLTNVAAVERVLDGIWIEAGSIRAPISDL